MNNKAILFDLDGTLADTARDIFAAANRLLLEENLAPITFPVLREHVALGGRSIIQFSFGDTLSQLRQDELLQRFLSIYKQNLCVDTCLFPSVIETLEKLVQRGMLVGVVTNKMQVLAEPLLERLGLMTLSSCEVYGDTTKHKKPDPLPLLHAAKLINIAPEQCTYVGDSVHDMQAAQAAHMQSVFVNYGYGYNQASKQDWSCTHRVNHFSEINEFVR